MCLCRYIALHYSHRITRLPQNAPNHTWDSKNFPGVIPLDPRLALGKCKVGNPTPTVDMADLLVS